jgi:hypothetical protein
MVIAAIHQDTMALLPDPASRGPVSEAHDTCFRFLLTLQPRKSASGTERRLR